MELDRRSEKARLLGEFIFFVFYFGFFLAILGISNIADQFVNCVCVCMCIYCFLFYICFLDYLLMWEVNFWIANLRIVFYWALCVCITTVSGLKLEKSVNIQFSHRNNKTANKKCK